MAASSPAGFKLASTLKALADRPFQPLIPPAARASVPRHARGGQLLEPCRKAHAGLHEPEVLDGVLLAMAQTEEGGGR